MNWNDRYINGDLPWETGRVDSSLPAVLSEHGIKPCSALELGCGTGNNAIWLAQNGFEVTALDLSDVALQAAKEKAVKAGVSVELSCDDITKAQFAAGPFGLVFDRGCFHSLDDDAARQKLAKALYERLCEGGYWLSLIGSTDGPDRDQGPPRLSAASIAGAVERHFEIISLRSREFDSDMDTRPRAWQCLMRKRPR